MTEKNTVREALAVIALEEIDDLAGKLEKVSANINKAMEVFPSYLEESGNQVIDNIKYGVITNIEIAQNTLTQAQKQLESNIELQRRLNAQLKTMAEKLDRQSQAGDNIKNIIIPALSAFLGALIAVLFGSIF